MSANLALEILKSIPRDDSGPVFEEPWQAQVFALAVCLNENGAFSWSEWGEILSGEIAANNDSAHYYDNWLTALEKILNKHQLIGEDERHARELAWERASLATRHGEPIELS